MKYDNGDEAGKTRRGTRACNRGDAKNRWAEHSPQGLVPYLIVVILFLSAASVVFWLDVKNLYDLWDFGGRVLSLASLPVAVGFMLILVFVYKVIAVIWHRAFNRLFSWTLVVLYLGFSLVALGIGHYFPAAIEREVNDRRQNAADYATSLNTWARETIDHAARSYRKPYVDAISRNIRWETEHGGCKAKCQKDKDLLEHAGRNWEAYAESLNRPVKLVEDFKKGEFDHLPVIPSFSGAKTMVTKANRLNLELVEKVDEAVSKIAAARPTIVEYFSPNKVARKEGAITDAGSNANAGMDDWPEWRPMDAETRDDLTLTFAGQVDFGRAVDAGIETVYIPLVLIFLFISHLLVEFLQTQRQLGALFSGGGIRDFINHEFHADAAPKELPFDDDWSQFLNSPAGRTWRLSPSKAFAFRLQTYAVPEAGADPSFHLLQRLAAHLLDSPGTGRHREILKSLVKSGESRVALDARIVHILGSRLFVSRLTLPRNPSTRLSWEVLRAGVREQLESFGGVLEVPFSRKDFLGSLDKDITPHKDAEGGNDTYYLYSPLRQMKKSIQIIENLVRFGIGPVDMSLADRLVQRLQKVEGIVIHADIPVLLREKGILTRLAHFVRDTDKAVTGNRGSWRAVFDDIMNALEYTEDRPGLDDLLELDKRLNRVDPDKLLKHAQTPLGLWTEIAREYTHRADNLGAESFLHKIRELRDGMERKGLDMRFVTDDLITAELVAAHNRADLLDYGGACQHLRTVMDRWERLETDAVQKCRSALGHILTVSGSPDDGRRHLEYAFDHISWSLSPQVGISLAMAWIADKKMRSLKRADAILLEVEKRLQGKDFILHRNSHSAWVRLGRVKLHFVGICRRKRGKPGREKSLADLDDIAGACARIPHEEEDLYFNQIALHLRNLASIALYRDTGESEGFYVTMADQIDKKLSAGDEPMNLVDCLQALMVTSHQWATRAVTGDGGESGLLETRRRSWAMRLGEQAETDEGAHKRIHEYLMDIASVDLSKERRLATRDLCKLLARAEYIPAILPTNLLE